MHELEEDHGLPQVDNNIIFSNDEQETSITVTQGTLATSTPELKQTYHDQNIHAHPNYYKTSILIHKQLHHSSHIPKLTMWQRNKQLVPKFDSKVDVHATSKLQA